MKATESFPGIVSMAGDQREEALYHAMPRRRLQWGYNTDRDRQFFNEYHQVLLQGMKWTTPKPTNLYKATYIKQSPDETFAAFLEHLLDT